MICTDSQEFFEISMGPQPSCGKEARLLCLCDFLKKCLFFPLALVGKALKTVLRLIGVVFSLSLLVVTLGSSRALRELFVTRIVYLAKDIADWILFPFALLWSCLRLILALIHPHFYFNAL